MTAAVRDAIVELRRYTLHRDRRDDLIALFEHAFVESQDAVGAHVLGLFRDLDDAARFVWLRGFASMPARFDALTAFYGGPVWQAHRVAANDTMRDSDNVLLLRPTGEVEPAAVPGSGACYLALIHDLGSAAADDFASLFDAIGRPMIAATGGRVTSTFVTEAATNTFTRLPVRTDARVHVCFARFADVDMLDAAIAAIGHANALREAASDPLLPAFMRKPEMLRLTPTDRSRWR